MTRTAAAVAACLITAAAHAQEPPAPQPAAPPEPSLIDRLSHPGMALLQDDAAGEEKLGESSIGDQVLEALVGGKLNFDLRLRLEIADQDGFDTSQAWTSRLRLGYGTKPLGGFSAYVELEDIRSIDDELYNAAGLNGQPDKTVIADPQDTELNQLFVKYANDWLAVVAGRQRITLDDHRFIGNVGWRQNEQTFDAASVKFTHDGFEAYYAYIDEVNRIFGPDADMDFRSDSHVINLSYAKLPWDIGKVTGFAYLLDFDNSDINSSNTFGVRLAGKQPINDDLDVSYIGSYAYQTDAGDNPVDYEAHYLLFEASLAAKQLGSVGAGYELLGSDDGEFAFRTPLATLHAFNGFADAFLVTPARGLQDFYLFAGTTLPWDIKAKVIYHWFWTDQSGGDLGEELDIVASKALNKYMTVVTKLAWLDGDNTIADRWRFWLQLDFKF